MLKDLGEMRFGRSTERGELWMRPESELEQADWGLTAPELLSYASQSIPFLPLQFELVF